MLIYRDDTTSLWFSRDTQGYPYYEIAVDDGCGLLTEECFEFSVAMDAIGSYAPLSWHAINDLTDHVELQS